jgi:large conductance mechanosensitive channel
VQGTEVGEMKGLVEFIRKQGVVGLAIGFIVGVAVGAVVNSLVTDLVNPLIGLVFQTRNLNTLVFHINKATFRYGNFIAILINFVVILAVVYLIFKVSGLEKLDIEEEGERD